MLLRSALLLLAAGLLASAEVAVAIRGETWIAAPHATLGDVAVLSGDEEVCGRLRGLTIADLPTLTPAQVDARLVTGLATRVAAPATLRISGSGVVARRARTFSDAEQYAAASAAVPGSRSAPVRCSGALTVPDGAALVAEPLDPAGLGEVAFRIRAVEDGREAGRSLVVLRVERDAEIAIAARAIARGATIGAQDVRRETRAATRANLAAAIDPADLVGCIARREIAAGEPIPPALVATRPAVRNGSTVTALWPGKGFLVELQAVAQADARAGERVALRRIGEQALFHGIAQDDGTVLVQP